MEFIADNYLWIILTIIIILMAIVGYIAEKNEFIKQTLKTVKPNKEKNNKVSKEQPIIIEDKGIDELLKSNIQKQEEPKSEQVMNNLTSTDIIMEPLTNQKLVDDTPIDQSLFAPLESPIVTDEVNNQDELNPIEVTQLQDIETNMESPVVNEEEDIWKF